MSDEDMPSIAEDMLESFPYVFVLRNAEKIPLYVGAYGGEMTWEEGQQILADSSPWWGEVEDYVRYFFRTEKRAWEYAMLLVDEFSPIHQPLELDPSQTPPPALLEAMVDPDPNPPKMVHARDERQ